MLTLNRCDTHTAFLSQVLFDLLNEIAATLHDVQINASCDNIQKQLKTNPNNLNCKQGAIDKMQDLLATKNREAAKKLYLNGKRFANASEKAFGQLIQLKYQLCYLLLTLLPGKATTQCSLDKDINALFKLMVEAKEPQATAWFRWLSGRHLLIQIIALSFEDLAQAARLIHILKTSRDCVPPDAVTFSACSDEEEKNDLQAYIRFLKRLNHLIRAEQYAVDSELFLSSKHVVVACEKLVRSLLTASYRQELTEEKYFQSIKTRQLREQNGYSTVFPIIGNYLEGTDLLNFVLANPQTFSSVAPQVMSLYSPGFDQGAIWSKKHQESKEKAAFSTLQLERLVPADEKLDGGALIKREAYTVRLPPADKIAWIESGKRYAFIKMRDGRLLVVGDNSWGNLGVKARNAKECIQLKIAGNIAEKVVKISAVEEQAVLLTDDGRVYFSGRNLNCSLGFEYGHQQNIFKEAWLPMMLIDPKRKLVIIDVKMTHTASYLLTQNNELLVAGWNFKGRFHVNLSKYLIHPGLFMRIKDPKIKAKLLSQVFGHG